MQRRRVLGLLILSAGAVLTRGWAFGGRRARRDGDVRTFFVAGVRYQGIAVSTLVPGTPLRLDRDTWRGEPCLRLRVPDGRSIGVVPRALVPAIARGHVRNAVLVGVRPHAVPWKQLEARVHLA